jgi:hypothetical protein
VIPIASVILTIDLAGSPKIKYPVTGSCKALRRKPAGAVSPIFVAAELSIGWRENIRTS